MPPWDNAPVLTATPMPDVDVPAARPPSQLPRAPTSYGHAAVTSAATAYWGCLKNRSSSLSVPRMNTVEGSIVVSYVSSDLVKA